MSAPADTGDTSPPLGTEVDYLARDFDPLRQLILDQMASVLPSWRERHIADLGNVIVDVLAYAGDNLSYYQDAVALEAYIGTARRRISVRRHARLLGYQLNEGVATRMWLRISVDQPVHLRKGLRVVCGEPGILPADYFRIGREDVLPKDGNAVFETMVDASLDPAMNEMTVWRSDGGDDVLRAGSRFAILQGGDRLKCGDVLILAADSSDGSGSLPVHRVRQAVRLDRDPVPAGAEGTSGPLFEIHWHAADALAVDLPLIARDRSGVVRQGICKAWGNILPADAGLTLTPGPAFEAVPLAAATAQIRLPSAPLIFAVPYVEAVERMRPAAALHDIAPDRAEPAVLLVETDRTGRSYVWHANRDLLDSNGLARKMQVEVEDDGTAFLRFGDGRHGREPPSGSRFTPIYRIGLPNKNVAAETARRWLPRDGDLGIVAVTNPLPAAGGRARQSTALARREAPAHFRRQQRCITTEDWVELLEQDPRVDAIAGEKRWIGTAEWLVLHVLGAGGTVPDRNLLDDLERLIEPSRPLGAMVALQPPVIVPIDIGLKVTIARHKSGPVIRAAVEQTVLKLIRSKGRCFGASFFLSQIIAAALDVEGVTETIATRFARSGDAGSASLTAGRIDLGPCELVRLDPRHARSGSITVELAK